MGIIGGILHLPYFCWILKKGSLMGYGLVNTILMLNIEDLIPQIISSALFQDELKRQIQQYGKDCHQGQPEPTKDVALPCLLQEINCYLSEITEMALEEENSRNYRYFMDRNEELWAQLEQRTNLSINRVSQELTAKMESFQLILNEKLKAAGRPAGEAGRLKEERRALTRNILQNSYLQNQDSTKSTLNIKSCIRERESPYSVEELAGERSGINSSLDSVADAQRLLEIQKHCKSEFKVLSAGFQGTVQGLRRQLDGLKKTQSSSSEQMQQKLQGNLQSIWNVISDLCSRLGKLEAFLPFQEMSS